MYAFLPSPSTTLTNVDGDGDGDGGVCRELEGLLGGGGRGRPGLGHERERDRGRSDEPDPRTVYVGYISHSVTEAELHQLFSSVGEVGACGLGSRGSHEGEDGGFCGLARARFGCRVGGTGSKGLTKAWRGGDGNCGGVGTELG